MTDEQIRKQAYAWCLRYLNNKDNLPLYESEEIEARVHAAIRQILLALKAASEESPP